MSQVGWPKFEDRVNGFADGFNVLFKTKQEYQAGTLRVTVNGLIKKPEWEDGFDELGNKKFRMKIAPQEGDVIGAYYVVAYG